MIARSHVESLQWKTLGRHKFLLPVLVLLGLFMCWPWLQKGVIVGGDWRYFHADTLREWFRIDQSWDASIGLGGPNTSLSGMPYMLALGALARVGIPYSVGARLVFFFQFAVLSLVAGYILATQFVERTLARVAAALLYGANTYILIVGTNQLTVGLAYVLAAFPIAMIARDFDNLGAASKAKWLVAGCGAGSLLALVSAVDPRIGLLALTAATVYAVSRVFEQRSAVYLGALYGLGMLSAVTLLQAYWIVPALSANSRLALSGELPAAPWLSWSTLRHALFLSHPFWTGGAPAVFRIQQPVVMLSVLPLAAAAGWFMRRTKGRGVGALAILAALGVFLVKGENPPLGGVYSWAFSHIPGMRLFRDMQKFNLFIALGYAVLVALLVDRFVDWFRLRRGLYVRILAAAGIAAVFTACLYPVVPAVAQKVGKVSHPQPVPRDNALIAQLLRKDSIFGRVLWAPQEPRFGYRTETHPALDLVDLAKDPLGSETPTRKTAPGGSDGALWPLYADSFQGLLDYYSVRYVAVAPDDDPSWPGNSEREKSMVRGKAVLQLEGMPALRRLGAFTTILVYENERVQPLVRFGSPYLVADESWPSKALDSFSSQPLFAAAAKGHMGNENQPLSIHALDLTNAVYSRHVVSTASWLQHGEYELHLGGTLTGGDSLRIADSIGEVLWDSRSSRTARFFVAADQAIRFEARSRAIASVLNGGSFETGRVWSVGDAQRTDSRTLEELGIASELSGEAHTGRFAMRLRALSHAAGASALGASSWDPGLTYSLDFWWRREKGASPSYAYWWGEGHPSARLSLGGGWGWNHVSRRFEVPDDATALGLSFFVTPHRGSGPSASLFDDVTVHSLPKWLPSTYLSSHPRSPTNATIDDSGTAFFHGRGSVRISSPPQGTLAIQVSQAFNSSIHARAIGYTGEQALSLRVSHVEGLGKLDSYLIEVPPGVRILALDTRDRGADRARASAIASALCLLTVVAAQPWARRRLIR